MHITAVWTSVNTPIRHRFICNQLWPIQYIKCIFIYSDMIKAFERMGFLIVCHAHWKRERASFNFPQFVHFPRLCKREWERLEKRVRLTYGPLYVAVKSLFPLLSTYKIYRKLYDPYVRLKRKRAIRYFLLQSILQKEHYKVSHLPMGISFQYQQFSDEAINLFYSLDISSLMNNKMIMNIIRKGRWQRCKIRLYTRASSELSRRNK